MLKRTNYLLFRLLSFISFLSYTSSSFHPLYSTSSPCLLLSSISPISSLPLCITLYFPKLLSSQLQFPFNYLAADSRPQLLTISIAQKVNAFCKSHNPEWACKLEMQQSTMQGFVSLLLFLPHSPHLAVFPLLCCVSLCPATACFHFDLLWYVNTATD